MCFKKQVTILFLYLLPSSLWAQTTAEQAENAYKQAEELFGLFVQQYEEEVYEQGLTEYQRAIENYQQLGLTNLTYADCYHKRGILYHIFGQTEEAIREYQQAINIKRQVDKSVDSLFFKELVLIGNIHFQNSNLDSAKVYYDKAERILYKYEDLYERRRLYNSLGIYYDAIGNYQQALVHYQQALSALYKSEPDYEYDKALLNNNIAQGYLKLGHYYRALEMLKSIEEGSPTTFLSLNIGFAFFNLEQYDSAIYHLKKSLRYDEAAPYETRTEIYLTALNDLGFSFLELNLIDSAAQYFNESRYINRQQLGFKNAELSKSYLGTARVKLMQDSVHQALQHYQQALIASTFDFEDTIPANNPSVNTVAISLLYQFRALHGKAGAWRQYYQQDQDTTKLVHALESYQRAIRVAQHIQKTYDNDEAKLFLVNKVAPVYEEAIATAVQLYELTGDVQYVTQAFQFSENSKAAVLAESLQDVKIKTLDGVNDSLVQEEHQLKQQITALRLQLVESQDSTQNEAYQRQLNDLEIALARTIKYLQEDEQYYQQKYQPDTLDVAALQRTLLDRDNALLEYFVGKDQLYLFLMTRQALQVVPIDRTAELDSSLQRIRQQLYGFQPGQKDDANSLSILYQYLLAPVAEEIADVSKLTVITDGPLHYLPFELLSSDGRRAHYLLRTHTLHYGYSAALLQQAIHERRGFPTKAVLAMAPFVGLHGGSAVRSQGFSLLRNSQAEIESVGGSIYTEGKATKRQFLKIAGSYNVLHLATHATVDSENPSQSFIAFYPDGHDSLTNYRLYTHELYNLRLDSVKLVVLSACETGNGQLVRGEGVMSLARAFAYAGCPNVVTTLWKADDRTSAYLTTRMHQYLKDGWEKDEALRQAKLDYLDDEGIQPSQKAPYYWAHFVFIGDPAPLYENHRVWWWIGLGGVLIAIVALLATWQRRQQAKVVA